MVIGTCAMKDYAIVAKDVSKIYKMYDNHDSKFASILFHSDKIKEFYALKGVTFNINWGESVGLIGLNGSGKSTLANILGKISEPSSGNIQINGDPTVIAIGTGLNPQLTGRENIEYKGLLIGLSRKRIAELSEDIIAFADLGEFIDQPVKTYSSGMRSRLGFSISVNIDPDILIIDEALSVGDPSFTQKCLEKMNDYRKRGKTIIFVSHSLSQVEEFCDHVMWLEYGVLKAYGKTEEVLPMYRRFLHEYNKMDKAQRVLYKEKVYAEQNKQVTEGR